MVRIQLSAEMIVFTSIARSASRWAARKSLDSSASLLLWLVPHPPCFNERTSDLRLAYALVTSQIENKPYCAVFLCVSLWPRDIRSILSTASRAQLWRANVGESCTWDPAVLTLTLSLIHIRYCLFQWHSWRIHACQDVCYMARVHMLVPGLLSIAQCMRKCISSYELGYFEPLVGCWPATLYNVWLIHVHQFAFTVFRVPWCGESLLARGRSANYSSELTAAHVVHTSTKSNYLLG